MKKLLIIFLVLGIGITDAKAWDFAEPNQDGDTLYYLIKDESTVSFDRWIEIPKNAFYEVDTLRLPETVTHNNTTYRVSYDPSDIVDRFGYVLDATKASPRTLMLPQTYRINRIGDLLAILQIIGKTNSVRLQNWAVDNRNKTLLSVDGVLYSRDRDTLVAFPPLRNGSFRVPQRVECITSYAFSFIDLDTLTLPDKDIILKDFAIYHARKMRAFRYSDYVARIEGNVISADSLEEITFGSGLEYIGGSMLPNTTVLKKVTCRAVTPPATGFNNFDNTERMALHVPRNSIKLYHQARGWKNFYTIEPIEPPIVSGVNSAEISWVTNAEASSYTLTLYLDAEQTRRLVTITFDDHGYMTNMDFNPEVTNAPITMPNRIRQFSEQSEDEDTENYSSYLAFTVTGLKAKTTYYFVRRSYNASGEVIDEETGSFETLSEAPEGTDEIGSEGGRTTRKIMEDGQVLIKRGKTTYTIQGTKMK